VDQVGADVRVTRWGRRALVLVAVGLTLQLLATFNWSPMTFILSAAIGLPAVLLGAVVFGVVVLRRPLREGVAPVPPAPGPFREGGGG
jgi:hypothetical protein